MGVLRRFVEPASFFSHFFAREGAIRACHGGLFRYSHVPSTNVSKLTYKHINTSLA